MACFIVPAVEAIAVTATYAVIKKHEMKIEAPKLAEGKEIAENDGKIKWSKKLGWLRTLLWGVVILLAFEHFWHGEIVPFPPFLTAMSDPVDKAEMLHEMATVGVSMAVTVTAIWGVVCAFADAKARKIRAAFSKNNA